MIIHGDPKAISAAYVKARGAMKATVQKDKKGNYGDYSTLAAIVEASTEHLIANGLAIVQEVSTDDVGVVIETWLVHESGTMMQFTPLVMPLSDRRPQAVGSAITYGRRYALAAVCGLAPADDDGQEAQHAETQARQTAQRRPQRTHADPNDDVDFSRTQDITEDDPQPNSANPTAEELAIINQWGNRTEAEMWAVMVGACENEHHARNSMAKSIARCGGKVTKENYLCVYVDFYRRQQEKLARQKEAA